MSPRRPKKPEADWLSWSLHLALGLFIGAAVGFYVALRLMRFRLIGDEQILNIVAGVSLFIGAITSYRGDSAWFLPSVFDPEEPPQSRTSHTCSLVIGGLGVGIVLLAMYRHLQTDTWHTHSHSFSAFDIPILLLLVLLIWLVVHALRTGTALDRYIIIYRDEAPTWFWLYVALTTLSVIYILFSLLQ